MGQQISDVGDQNLNALCEHEATASVVEADCGYLSSRIERLIKLVQSRLAARVHGQPRQSAARQQLLQEGVSMTPATGGIVPLRVTDISAVDISFDVDQCDMGVAVPDVLIKPVGLYCRVPLKNRHKVDTYVGHQLVNDSHHSTAKTCDISEHLSAEISSAECDMCLARNVTVVMSENEVAKLSVNDVSRDEVVMDVRSRSNSGERYSRRRPPHSPKLITTPAQLANESRPSEIGSYLAVAPEVSCSDLGLSPIDETAEVTACTSLLLMPNTSDIDSTCKPTLAQLSNGNFSSDAVCSGYHVFGEPKVADCVKSKSYGCVADKCQRHLLDITSSAPSLYPVFLSADNSFCSLQTSTPSLFVLADTGTAGLSDDKAVCVKANASHHTCTVSLASVPDIAADIETSASDLTRTERDAALSCYDQSANNNGPGKPVAARVSTGPMVARRQVRYSSEGSSPPSPSVPAGNQTSTVSGHNAAAAASSMFQSTSDDVFVSQQTVPYCLDFQQLETFEGQFSVVC